MIERIEWESGPDELRSPFMRGKGERPLRITFHSQNLANLSGEEKAAVELLRELTNLPELVAFETSPGYFPHIVVDEPDPKDDFIPVRLMHRDTELMSTLVWNKRQWPILAEQLVDSSKEASGKKLETLVLAQAHRSVRGDILVTKSPLLLSNRNQTFVSETNPRTPLEAAQLIGLFLRSRNNYTYSATQRSKRITNRGTFYWVLARHRLPNMWRYFSACVEASKVRRDDIMELGNAILIRAVRGLEARDAIGIQFYMPQEHDTIDQIMYHFDYLTLVLAGAIDAQARVAHRAYHLSSQERFASFRYDKFRRELERKGAQKLYELCSTIRFQSLLILLYELRNMIHGSALNIIANQDHSRLGLTFLVTIPKALESSLLQAAEQLGGTNEWGLSSEFHNVLFEPYAYATALVRESLDAINNVAAYTDVTRLFPDEQSCPSFIEEAPKNSLFSIADRVSLLG